jgi:hypothetical protein
MNSETLWHLVRSSFDLDDGSLPAVELHALSVDEVGHIYASIRTRSGTVVGFPSFWDYESNTERGLDEVPNAALLVAEGKAAAFHFLIEGSLASGVRLPTLGFQIFEDVVAVDYRMGPDWGPLQVFAFFGLLKDLLAMSRCGRLELAVERPPNPSAFRDAWEKFSGDTTQ